MGPVIRARPGRADFVISEFEEYAVRIDDPNPTSRETEREGKDSLTLLKSQNPRELAELQKRLAVPFGILTLGLLAVPLSRVPPRAGAWGNILKAFLIYVAYENLQKISHGLLIGQKVPLPLAYGGAYLLIGLLTLGILIRQMGWRWLLYRVSGSRSRREYSLPLHIDRSDHGIDPGDADPAVAARTSSASPTNSGNWVTVTTGWARCSCT